MLLQDFTYSNHDVTSRTQLCQDVTISNSPSKPKSAAVSKHMSGIRTKRTGVEQRARKVLRGERIKFKGNVKSLPGSPDLVIPELGLVIFVNGCFWHGCPRCYTAPKHNRAWWNKKIAGNRRRDRRVTRKLRDQGYSVIHLWEHDSDKRMQVRVRGALKRQYAGRRS